MKYYIKSIGFTAIVVSSTFLRILGQNGISGPVCVIPGMAIQYNVNFRWDSSSPVQICITNGRFVGTRNTCYTGKPVASILVEWNNSGTSGSIDLSYAGRKASTNVRITRQLQPGIIDGSDERQEIAYNSSPAPMRCSPALWGTCSPIYRYQWQVSFSRSNWTDIMGATGPSLSISRNLTQSCYFRRKVTETKTNTVGLSNVATVIVKPR